MNHLHLVFIAFAGAFTLASLYHDLIVELPHRLAKLARALDDDGRDAAAEASHAHD